MGTPLPCPGLLSPCRLAAVAVAAAMLAFAAAPSGAAAQDPVVMAAGDIACASPGSASPGDCSQTYTSNLALAQQAKAGEGLAALLAAGDTQYENGTLREYQQYFTPSWGRAALRGVLRPALGNHEYQTGGAAGYFDYFSEHRRQRRCPRPGLVQLRCRRLAPDRAELERRVPHRELRRRLGTGDVAARRPGRHPEVVRARLSGTTRSRPCPVGVRSSRRSTAQASTSCSRAIPTPTGRPGGSTPTGRTTPAAPTRWSSARAARAAARTAC